MKKLQSTDFPQMISAARAASGDFVYPLSIAEGIQSGEIYTSENAVLFRHTCGFAYISGKPDSAFLQETEDAFSTAQAQQQRFVLITEDANVIAFFASRPAYRIGKRIYYEAAQNAPAFDLPEGFTLRRMNAALLAQLSGSIIPSFSWTSSESFLEKGFGCCILHGSDIAASAFTAANTAKFTDIGVETSDSYRRTGLAKIAAAAVMQDIQLRGKTPVWAHHAANLGSLKTAEALGFLPVRICRTIEKI